jgi:hypothetical protein
VDPPSLGCVAAMAGSPVVGGETAAPRVHKCCRGSLVDPHLSVLIKAKQARLGIVMDRAESLIDRTETIDQPVAIGESRMPQHLRQAKRVQRRPAAITRHFSRQLEKHVRQQKIAVASSRVQAASAAA